MLIEKMSVFGTAQLRRRLSSLGDGDSSDVELALAEVRDRRRIAPRLYPFTESEAGIATDPSVDPRIYSFLVLASIPGSRFREERDYSAVAVLFDLVAADALRSALGPRSTAIRFAWPTRTDRPSGFPEALRWLADKVGVSPGVVEAPPRKKDGGVDVVAWRPFLDGRSSFPIILGQCTVRTDFQTKGGDIVLDQWRAWLGFGRDPGTALAVPFAVPTSASEWEEDLRFTVDLFLDRLRLCELLEDVLDTLGGYVGDLDDWLSREINGLLL